MLTVLAAEAAAPLVSRLAVQAPARRAAFTAPQPEAMAVYADRRRMSSSRTVRYFLNESGSSDIGKWPIPFISV